MSHERRRLRWRWGRGVLDRQHNPSLLDSGHILVFDNGSRRGFSRVVELDPGRGEIVWEYRGTEVDPFFFSVSRGSCQRLANGNTLICESDSGRLLEVTPEGETVWEYFCPVLSTDPETGVRRRSAIYRARRIEELPQALESAIEGSREAAASG